MRLLIATSVLAITTACKVTDPKSMETAPDAVLTFQARLARDDVAGELACFSQRFREQSGGLSLQGYATLRDRFLAPLGWFGRLLLQYDSLEDNLTGVDDGAGLHVRLYYSLFGHAFEVDAVPEARFTFPDPDGVPTGAPLSRGATSLEPRGAVPPKFVAIEWNMAPDAARRLVASGLPWAELANEWRLEGVTPLEETPKSAAPPAAPTPPRPKLVIHVAALAVHQVRASFGSVTLRVELELGEPGASVRTLPDGTLLVGDGPDAPRLRWETSTSSSAGAADPR